jgi:hypothetical protein
MSELWPSRRPPEKKSRNHTSGAVEVLRLVIIRDGKFVGPVKKRIGPADEKALSAGREGSR